MDQMVGVREEEESKMTPRLLTGKLVGWGHRCWDGETVGGPGFGDQGQSLDALS